MLLVQRLVPLIARMGDEDEDTASQPKQDNGYNRDDTTSASPTAHSQQVSPSHGLSICQCDDHWTWNRVAKTREVRLHGEFGRTAHFHPNWSSSTAAVRGNRVLNNGVYYWEIRVSERLFGTSMMFGIGTAEAKIYAPYFVNLLGDTKHSMGLSHKGQLCYNGASRQYTKPFRENQATTVGLLFNGIKGTLTYYKDGVCLGVAFDNLDKIEQDLYPMISSTAAKTEMTLMNSRRCYTSLQDRCRHVIRKHIDSLHSVNSLPIPRHTKEYLLEDAVPEEY